VALPFFTIGHSDRSLDDFVALLQAAGVGLVADVRTVPRSRANPQFGRDRLPESLAAFGVGYAHLAALGGLRGKSATPPGVNGFWTNQSFHNYADYALTAPFAAGIDELTARGRERCAAIMCAEAVWWRCHRRIVADHLLARGETVFHIIGPGPPEVARLTRGAVIRPDGAVVYPAAR
jgi:uncharacterized protein (DUF488 family)